MLITYSTVIQVTEYALAVIFIAAGVKYAAAFRKRPFSGFLFRTPTSTPLPAGNRKVGLCRNSNPKHSIVTIVVCITGVGFASLIMENKGRAEAMGEETHTNVEQGADGVRATASARSTGQGTMGHETTTMGDDPGECALRPSPCGRKGWSLIGAEAHSRHA